MQRLIRIVILAAAALGLALVAVDCVRPFHRGTLGIAAQRTSATTGVVTRVDRGSPASEVLRAGDRVALIGTTWFGVDCVKAGEPVAMRRDDGTAVSLRAARYETSFVYIWAGIRLTMLVLAAVIVLRASGPGSRDLPLVLAGLGLFCDYWIYPGYAAALGALLRDGATVTAAFGLVRFCSAFPEGASGDRVRTAIARSTPWLIAAFALVVAWQEAYRFAPSRWNAAAPAAVTAFEAAVAVLAIVALRRGIRSSEGQARQRLLWIGSALSVAVASGTTYLVLGALPSRPWFTDGFAVLVIVLPLCLGYAILVHRVIDIGFAINLVTVYSIVSTLMLLAFSGLKSLAEHLVPNIRGSASQALDAPIVMAVSLVITITHHRVKLLVDRVLFAARRARIMGLKAARAALTEIADDAALAQSCVRALVQCGFAREAAMYAVAAGGVWTKAHGGDAFPETLPANDALSRAVRGCGDVVFVGDTASALDAFAAVPLAWGSDAVALIVFRSDAGRDSFGPDELEALREFGRSAAFARAVLRVRSLESGRGEAGAVAAEA
jgi:hypothetical protein